MKKLFLFISLTILLVSCQANLAPQPTATFAPTNTPVPPAITSQVFSNDYHVGNPVENDSQAQIAALEVLKASFTYIEPLIVVMVEKMNYGEAKQLIEQPLTKEADLKIWMVIYFNNEWNIARPDLNGTPLPVVSGCIYMVIKADNGDPVEAGGPINIKGFSKCEK